MSWWGRIKICSFAKIISWQSRQPLNWQTRRIFLIFPIISRATTSNVRCVILLGRLAGWSETLAYLCVTGDSIVERAGNHHQSISIHFLLPRQSGQRRLGRLFYPPCRWWLNRWMAKSPSSFSGIDEGFVTSILFARRFACRNNWSRSTFSLESLTFSFSLAACGAWWLII